MTEREEDNRKNPRHARRNKKLPILNGLEDGSTDFKYEEMKGTMLEDMYSVLYFLVSVFCTLFFFNYQ